MRGIDRPLPALEMHRIMVRLSCPAGAASESPWEGPPSQLRGRRLRAQGGEAANQELQIERRGRISVLTLSRPERHNALSPDLSQALADAIKEFDDDPAQRVAVITGAGERAFCAGADLKILGERMEAGIPPGVSSPDIGGVGACRKPVIAAINGLAVGGGFELALCCDIRIAADTAWFAFPEASRGLLAAVAVSLLPRMIPIGAAMDLLLAGERMSAAEAWRLGLVQMLVPPEALLTTAMAKAEVIASSSPTAVAASKKMVRAWRDHLLAEQHRVQQDLAAELVSTGDVREGLRAFAEKRAPSFADGQKSGRNGD
ncbi:MAG: hypothetical protein JWP15_3028 [Alphaproteobacteria bacterium]|nr:hypothetical protein [Alphaproteobacteria bacterium]